MVIQQQWSWCAAVAPAFFVSHQTIVFDAPAENEGGFRPSWRRVGDWTTRAPLLPKITINGDVIALQSPSLAFPTNLWRSGAGLRTRSVTGP